MGNYINYTVFWIELRLNSTHSPKELRSGRQWSRTEVIWVVRNLENIRFTICGPEGRTIQALLQGFPYAKLFISTLLEEKQGLRCGRYKKYDEQALLTSFHPTHKVTETGQIVLGQVVPSETTSCRHWMTSLTQDAQTRGEMESTGLLRVFTLRNLVRDRWETHSYYLPWHGKKTGINTVVGGGKEERRYDLLAGWGVTRWTEGKEGDLCRQSSPAVGAFAERNGEDGVDVIIICWNTVGSLLIVDQNSRTVPKLPTTPVNEGIVPFRWKGRYYQCLKLPLGWGRSLLWLYQPMETCVSELKSCGTRELAYLDCFLSSPSP